MDVADLPARWLEILAAGVPATGIVDADQFGQCRRERMHRVLGEVRVGDVALHALDGELGRQRAAAAVLDHVAELFD